MATIYLGSQQRITVKFTTITTAVTNRNTATTTTGSSNLASYRLPYKQTSGTIMGTIVWIGTATPKSYSLQSNSYSDKLATPQIVTFAAGTGGISLPNKDRRVVYKVVGVVGALVDKNGTLLDTETLTSSKTIGGITFPAGTILPKYYGVGTTYTITVNQDGSLTVA